MYIIISQLLNFLDIYWLWMINFYLDLRLPQHLEFTKAEYLLVTFLFCSFSPCLFVSFTCFFPWLFLSFVLFCFVLFCFSFLFFISYVFLICVDSAQTLYVFRCFIQRGRYSKIIERRKTTGWNRTKIFPSLFLL